MLFPINGGTTTAPSRTAANIGSLVMTNGGKSWGTTHDYVPCPGSATIIEFGVVLTTAPGAGKSYQFDIIKNGSVAMSVTISDTATFNRNLTSFSYVKGDLLDIQVTPTGTPAATGVLSWWAKGYSTDGSQHIFGGCQGTTSVPAYRSLMGDDSFFSTSTLASDVMPIGGTFSDLYVKSSTPGGPGDSYIFTIYVNNVASALTTTVAYPATTNSDNTHSVTVGEGSVISLLCDTNGALNALSAAWGIKWFPNEKGKSVVIFGGNAAPSSGSDNYIEMPGGGTSTIGTTENSFQRAMPYTCFTDMRVRLLTDVGAGSPQKSLLFTVRRNGVSTNLQTIMITGLTQNRPGDRNVIFELYDELSVLIHPANTPNVGAGMSVVLGGYVDPILDENGNFWRPSSI